jgi:hypothetical protein
MLVTIPAILQIATPLYADLKNKLFEDAPHNYLHANTWSFTADQDLDL